MAALAIWLTVARPLWTRVDAVLALLVAWAAVSVAWSPFPQEGVARGLNLAACFVVFVLISRARHLAVPAMSGLFAGGAIVAYVGLAQFFGGLEWPARWEFFGSTLANPNVAAEVVVMTMPFAVLVGWRAAALGLPAMVAYLAISDCLAAQLALGVMVAWWFYERADTTDRVCVLVLAAATSLALLPLEFSVDPMSGLGQRFGFATNTLGMIGDNPMGVGLGGWAAVYSSYTHDVVPEWSQGIITTAFRAHNDYLQYAAELGLVGAVLAAVAVWVVAPRIRYGVVVLPLVALAVLGAAAFPMQRAIPPLIAAVVLGWAVGPLPCERVSRALTSGAAAAATVVLAVWYLMSVVGDWHHRQAYYALYRGDLAVGGRHAALAARLNPLNPLPPEKVGLAMMYLAQPALALKAFRRSLELRPNQPRVLWHIAVTAERLGDYDLATRATAAGLALVPGSPELRRNAKRLRLTWTDPS